MTTDQQTEDYIVQHIESEMPVLYDLYRYTHLKVLNPRMISGHLQGTILTLLSQMIKPVLILEIGTYTGYSSICLAKGLQEKGLLHTIEINDELNELALCYFKKAKLEHKIKLFNGNAIDIIPTLNFKYDIVFMDAEKKEYSLYYDLAFDKVKSGGYFLVDNILWDGKVVDESFTDPTTQSLREFNNKMKSDPRVTVTIIPVRDGLAIIRKK